MFRFTLDDFGFEAVEDNIVRIFGENFVTLTFGAAIEP
jgi:hypothetical protein